MTETCQEDLVIYSADRTHTPSHTHTPHTKTHFDDSHFCYIPEAKIVRLKVYREKFCICFCKFRFGTDPTHLSDLCPWHKHNNGHISPQYPAPHSDGIGHTTSSVVDVEVAWEALGRRTPAAVVEEELMRVPQCQVQWTFFVLEP